MIQTLQFKMIIIQNYCLAFSIQLCEIFISDSLLLAYVQTDVILAFILN